MHIIDKNTLDSLVILDVETTGLSPCLGDRVCEIGAVKVKNGRIVDTFHSLINPQRQISYGAYLVNGISQEMVDQAPTFREIALDFLLFIENTRIAAYNSWFDISFINSELNIAGEHHTLSNNDYLDILIVARNLLPGLPGYSLSKVARSLKIKISAAHRALDDSILAWRVLKKIHTISSKTSTCAPE
ncbi:MAG: 3'-5' exonuclease [bacterium]